VLTVAEWLFGVTPSFGLFFSGAIRPRPEFLFSLMKKETKKIKAWVYRPPGKRLSTKAQKLIPERKPDF
jgi:hypothetical protein